MNTKNFVGVDLHKKTITVCVMDKDRKILGRRRLWCMDEEGIAAFFEELKPFSVVVEATASYYWFLDLIEPLADKVVLAHPGKLRVIAESTRKSDKLDATVLAEFLVLDMIPPAHRPTPRQREHRALVRQRRYHQRRRTAVSNKIRRILSDYNVDEKNALTVGNWRNDSRIPVGSADRFILDQLFEELDQHTRRLRATDERLRKFAESAPTAESEARAVLETIPGVGPITVDVVVSELGDVLRFGSAKKVCSYAGLCPGQRESAGRSRSLGITKQGSKLLRWALVEAAWRLVRFTRRWQCIFEGLAARRGKKKAIVAIARRLLCVMVAMLRAGQAYRPEMIYPYHDGAPQPVAV